MILECCGCKTVFFAKREFFSEDVDYEYDPLTGEPICIPNIKKIYWPAPSKRAAPKWIDQLRYDHTLFDILMELYAALGQDLRVLGAVGVRTAFDRSAQLLGIDPSLRFFEVLDALQEQGKIGLDERSHLSVLVDAGSAAAHRGWKPEPQELSVMVEILETFLHRTFVLGGGVAKLKAAAPGRPPKKQSRSLDIVVQLERLGEESPASESSHMASTSPKSDLT